MKPLTLFAGDSSMKGLASWFAVAVLAVSALPAQAQFVNPYYYPTPYPYYPYGPYYNPYAGNLYGAAAVIGAQNQQMLATQQAYLGREAVKRAKLENRRAALDEWKYEQANTPTREDLRERSRAELLRRVRNDPASGEIWSGLALNVLLQDLQRLRAYRTHTETALLSPDVLSRINLSGSPTDASLGLLRDGGRLQWPFPLREPAFDADRQAIDRQLPAAVVQAKAGTASAEVIGELSRSVKQLLDRLNKQVNDMLPNQWIEAKRYADQLQDAVRTLQDPSVAKILNGKWQAAGNTVEELVRHMTDQGLHFAPATQGDETAYVSLYQDLLNYDTALGLRMARAEMTAVPKRQ